MANLPKSGVELVAENQKEFYDALANAAKAAENLGSAAADGAKPVERLGKAATDASGGFDVLHEIGVGALREIGAIATTVIGQIGSLAGAVVGFAADVSDSQKDLQAEFGLTAEEAAELSESAQDLFGAGFGESIGDVSRMLAMTRQQLGDLGDVDLSNITAGAANIADAFDADYDEVINAVKAIRDNFPGTTEAQALDLITAGFQSGLNSSDDFLDSVREYSNQFGSVGASADQFFSTLQSGLGAGVLGTDKIADAIKEFNLRILDGSTSTAEALAAIDLSFLPEQINSGAITSADALGLIIEKLSEVDEATRREVGTALIGTQFEDLAFSVEAFAGIAGGAFANVEGAVDSLAVKQQTFSSLWEQTQRGALLALEPLAAGLLELGTIFLPIVQDALAGFGTFVEAVTGSQEALAELSPTLAAIAEPLGLIGQYLLEGADALASDGLGAGIATFATGLSEISPLAGSLIGALAPIGDLIQSNLIPALAGIGIAITGGVIVAFGGMVAAAAPVIATAAAIGAATAGIAAAWQNDLGGIQGIVSSALGIVAGLWESYGPTIIDSATTTFNTALDVVQSVMAAIMGVVEPILAIIANFWEQNGADILNFVASTWSQIASIVQTALQVVQAVVVPILSGIAAFISDNSAEIQAVLTSAWNIISGVVETALNLIQGIIQTVLAAVQGDWSGAWNTLKQTSATFVMGIWDVIRNVLNTIPPLFTTMLDGAKRILSGAIGTFVSLGSDIIQGLIDGFWNAKAKVDGAIRDIANSAINSAKAALGISSPSRAFREEIGFQSGEGWAIGLEDSAPVVLGVANDIALSLVDTTQEQLDSADDLGTAFVDAISYGITVSEPELVASVKGLGDKVAEIERDMQAQLLAIDAEAAQKRADVQRDLYADIQQSQAAIEAQLAANDFDLFGKLSEQQANNLAIREAAEANYLARVTAAREEAREAAQSGDAELAKEVLAAKEKEAADLKKIEEDYMKKRAEVSKQELPALEETYMRAVALRQNQTAVEIDLAQQSAQQRARALEEEKKAVVNTSQEQVDEVIKAAQEQAEGVGRAAGEATARGVKATEPQVKAVSKQAGEIAIQGIEEGASGAESTGKNIAQGIAAGIDAGVPAIMEAARSAARAALEAAKDELGIASPSKETAIEVGLPVVQGIVQGIGDNLDLIKGMAKKLSKQLTEDLEKVARSAADAFKNVLRDNLAADVGFASTVLDNFRVIEDILGQTNISDAIDDAREAENELKRLQSELAELGEFTLSDETMRKRAREDEDYEAKRLEAERNLQEVLAERDRKIQEIRASSDFEENKQRKIAELMQSYASKEESTRKRIDDLEKSRARTLEDRAIADQKALEAYRKQRLELEAQIEAQKVALEWAKAVLKGEMTLNENRRTLVNNARQAIADARAQADEMRKIDPKTAEAWFRLRSEQITAEAQLEAEILNSDAKRADQLRKELELLKQVHAAETALFAVESQAESPFAQVVEDLTTLQNKLRAELERDQGFYNLTDKNNKKMRADLEAQIAADQHAINQITALLERIGTASIQGITAGVEGGVAELMQEIQNAMELAQKAAEQALGIASPSKVFENEVGEEIPAGVAKGIIGNMSSIYAAMDRMQNAMISQIQPMAYQRVAPVASSSALAGSSYVTNHNANTSIGTLNAPGGLTKADVISIFNTLMLQTGQTAYNRRATR